MSRSSKIRSGFNFLSYSYDLFSFLFFGNSILNSQKYFLSDLGKFENVLIFGGGTGKILIECFKNKISDRYTYVDISDKMTARTKRRSNNFRKEKMSDVKTVFICGSYDSIPSEIKFDLIITPYVLDCFSDEELPIVMRSLSEKLSPKGKWLFADFNVPEKGVMNFFSRSIIRTLYFFFHVFCGLGIKRLPDLEKHFEELKFNSEKERLFLKGMLTAKIYSRQ